MKTFINRCMQGVAMSNALHAAEGVLTEEVLSLSEFPGLKPGAIESCADELWFIEILPAGSSLTI